MGLDEQRGLVRLLLRARTSGEHRFRKRRTERRQVPRHFIVRHVGGVDAQMLVEIVTTSAPSAHEGVDGRGLVVVGEVVGQHGAQPCVAGFRPRGEPDDGPWRSTGGRRGRTAPAGHHGRRMHLAADLPPVRRKPPCHMCLHAVCEFIEQERNVWSGHAHHRYATRKRGRGAKVRRPLPHGVHDAPPVGVPVHHPKSFAGRHGLDEDVLAVLGRQHEKRPHR